MRCLSHLDANRWRFSMRSARSIRGFVVGSPIVDYPPGRRSDPSSELDRRRSSPRGGGCTTAEKISDSSGHARWRHGGQSVEAVWFFATSLAKPGRSGVIKWYSTIPHPNLNPAPVNPGPGLLFFLAIRE